MKIYYDLHIHSVLSPCADRLMTPNHIVLMAQLKKLNCIALTDHNSTKNCPAVFNLCQEAGLTFIPGIEVETIEGVHLLCYFNLLEIAELFGIWIEAHLKQMKNNKELFGQQWVMNEKDEVIEEYPSLLIQSTDLSCEEVVLKVHELNGVVIAAHINKPSNNILTNLGFIPPNLKLDGVELNSWIYDTNGQAILPNVAVYKQYMNSDAHALGFINEANYYFELSSENESVFDYLKGGR